MARKPQRPERATTGPTPPSFKSKFAQRLTQLADMAASVATPSGAQLGLQGHERQALSLHLDRDRRQQSGQTLLKRRETFARGLRLGAFLFGTLRFTFCSVSLNTLLQTGDICAHV
jgi:hypothetical protein